MAERKRDAETMEKNKTDALIAAKPETGAANASAANNAAPKKTAPIRSKTVVETDKPAVKKAASPATGKDNAPKPEKKPYIKKMDSGKSYVKKPAKTAEVVAEEPKITAKQMVEEKLLIREEPEEAPAKKKRKFMPPDPSKVTRYSPDLKTGLSSQQVEQRREDFLTNETRIKYTKSYKSIFLTNIFSFFNLLCFIVVGFLLSVGAYKDCLFIIIILANLFIGLLQECLAKKKMEKLSIMNAPTANVIRDGLSLEVPIKDIVLDDVIFLNAGKQIPTDCILAEGAVEVNESLLTGESVPLKKSVGDTLLAGSFVSSGNCKVRAEKVGRDNYIETLTAKAKKYKKPNSELLNSLNLIIRVIGSIILPIAALMSWVNFDNSGLWSVTIQKTAAVIIGMIPSGMYLLTTMALAVGVKRLAKSNTLVQDLYSLEMLARVDVLCLDKTGTITDGSMKVSDCLLLNNRSSFTLNEIIGSMLSALNDNNQTSMALYNHFGHSNALKPLNILSFSSKRKLSAVTFAEAGTYILGAPEFVLPSTTDKLDRMINQYASMGMRVLILAQAPGNIAGEKMPGGVKPVALITLADNIREDAPATIKWFKENDVEIKVISGDNPVTVSEIARRVGITNSDKYVSLENLSDIEVESIATKYTVFGRVSPEQKSILIRALKAAKRTVAMTGDGVNDILAMKEAHCSIAIASGSDAAKNVAHLVLTNSEFSAMPKIVNEGRRVINNIQKSSSLFLMKTLFTLIFAIIAIVSWEQYPFSTKNLLLLEAFVIGAPSFFLALQANTNRVKGRFINHVISRSLPGAFVMILNVLILMILNKFTGILNVGINGETVSSYETLAMMGLTLGGLVVLFKLCQPLNAYRGILCAVMATIVLILLSVGQGFFETLSLPHLGWERIIMIVCLVQFNFLLIKGLNALADKLK